MSATLTVTIDEENGRLRFSRNLILGSEYTLAFEGSGDESPSVVVFNSSGTAIASSSAGVLKLNTASLSSLFENGMSTRPKSVWVYAYSGSVVLGCGVAIVMYSPLSFESGSEPELVTGLAESIAEHIADKSNPHNVTAAQAGAAQAYHTHDVTGATFPIFQGSNGKMYQILIVEIGGIPTITLEEYEAP